MRLLLFTLILAGGSVSSAAQPATPSVRSCAALSKGEMPSSRCWNAWMPLVKPPSLGTSRDVITCDLQINAEARPPRPAGARALGPVQESVEVTPVAFGISQRFIEVLWSGCDLPPVRMPILR